MFRFIKRVVRRLRYGPDDFTPEMRNDPEMRRLIAEFLDALDDIEDEYLEQFDAEHRAYACDCDACDFEDSGA